MKLRNRQDARPLYLSCLDSDDSDEDESFSTENEITDQRGVINETESKEVTLLRKMEKILDCEMRPTESNDLNDSDNEVPNDVVMKHYLVKWKESSYLHCSWVSEDVFEKAYKSIRRLRYRVRKFHMELDRCKEFGFVAIRPEWTTVDRIMACRGEGDKKEYLVKYKEVCETYWEFESNISTFQKEIQRFIEIDSGHRRDKYVENERNQTDFKQFDHTPEFLSGSLHPYQLEGLNFLRFSWSKKTHVILADEMGLGKTIQSIAFLASLFEENLAPFLVVAPLTTLSNWEREFETWAPHMNVVRYGGDPKARDDIRFYEFYFRKSENKINRTSGSSGKTKQDRIKFDVLLTSNEIINIDKDHLSSLKWECMIVDEGHQLKNSETKLFSSLKEFTSMHRVLLTGTPLQNNLNELFTLIHFLDAEKFGSLENLRDGFKDISKEEQISRLHEMVAPHLLRRLKKDVLKDMPSKKELILCVDMSIQQKEIYKAILTRNFKVLTSCSELINIRNMVMELRKICLHPYMLKGVQPAIEDANEAYKHFVESSGKLQLLDKMMVRLKEQGHRVLIYSQFQNMLNLLEDYCIHKDWFYERLDGKVDTTERQIRIDRFNAENSNRFCFLLSTRAGGLGINLATADTVIIYDSDWNPHVDLQAIARAHRIGQKKSVMIYRLINRGTVEERMLQTAKKKMLLEHLVVESLNSKSICQKELDDIVRYGSKEIFSEGNEEAGTSRKIQYDDAAIEKLLDRDHIDAEEVSADDEKENEFLKAFKVANFEYIDENDDDALEEAQAIENESSDEKSERANYWKDLLKDKYEEDKAEEAIVLGKRKRSSKKISLAEVDNLDGFEVSSDESYKAEQTDGEAEAVELEIPKARRKTCKRRAMAHKSVPLMEGEGKSLKVLGFNQKQRKTFSKTVMRYGLGDYDWKEFVKPLKPKTYNEIKVYGALFLRHISEVITGDTCQAFSDGVPKEGLKVGQMLVRITLMTLIKEKLKMLEENPTKHVFPNGIRDKFPALNGTSVWKEEHDKILLSAVYKHGYGMWQNIIDENVLGMQKIVRTHLGLTDITLSPAQQVAINGSASSYGEHKDAIIQYKGLIKKLVEFVKERFLLLERAMLLENAEEYYFGQNGLASKRTKQAETVVHTEADKEPFDQLPKTDPIISIIAAAVDNKKERVTQMYENISENWDEQVYTRVERQAASSEVKENLRPLKSIFQSLHMSLSGTRASHGVERKDSVQEPIPERTNAELTNAVSGGVIEETQNIKNLVKKEMD